MVSGSGCLHGNEVGVEDEPPDKETDLSYYCARYDGCLTLLLRLDEAGVEDELLKENISLPWYWEDHKCLVAIVQRQRVQEKHINHFTEVWEGNFRELERLKYGCCSAAPPSGHDLHCISLRQPAADKLTTIRIRCLFVLKGDQPPTRKIVRFVR